MELDVVLIIAYALVCLAIGYYSSRGQKDEEYLIADRELTGWGFSASLLASYMGGSAIVAYTAYVYEFGISATILFLGVAMGYVIFYKYAKKIREKAKADDFHTLSDWFQSHFGESASFTSAVIVTIVYFGYLTSQFIAGSTILSAISGWSYETALLAASGLILVYLLLGGFQSVVKTDLFQYAVLFVLFLLIGWVLIDEHGVTQELLNPANMGPSLLIAFFLYGVISIFVGVSGWQRIYAVKDDKELKKGIAIVVIFTVVIGLALTFIGMAAASGAPNIPARDAISAGLSSLLPAGLSGFALVFLFAAIMSSADTAIFILAPSMAKDYFSKFKEEFSHKDFKKYSQAFTLATSVIAVIMAYFFRDLVNVVITIIGVQFALFPGVLASFHWSVEEKAVTAGLIAGLLYVIGLVVAGIYLPEAAVASALVAGLATAGYHYGQPMLSKIW